jgi:large subunit ribosomal protein L15
MIKFILVLSMAIAAAAANATLPCSPLFGSTAVTELTPATVMPAPGSRHRKARKGRGISAGQGASCGFGMRGQRSRSGPGVRAGFEGGQQPLYRRLPKFVGRPMGPGHTKKEFHLITLEALNAAEEGATVSFETLYERGK